MSKKLLIIDGNALIHRAFHAIPPLTNKLGEPTNAVYGFVSIILRVIGDLNPNSIAVCFDVKVPTFRHKEFKSYQAQRPPMADELTSQIQKANGNWTITSALNNIENNKIKILRQGEVSLKQNL